MKGRDLDKERSEKPHTLLEFLHLYNENLPRAFPPASVSLLTQFKNGHPSFFKSGAWSLEQHRKRVMDWLQLATLRKK
jgi:hypothetical protein